MNNGDEKRAKIIAEQAAREAARPASPRPAPRKPRSNWAASSGPGRPRRQPTGPKPEGGGDQG